MQPVQRKGRAASTHLHVDLVLALQIRVLFLTEYLLPTRHACLLFSACAELEHGVGGRMFSDV